MVCYRLQEDCGFNPTISFSNEIIKIIRLIKFSAHIPCGLV